MLPPQRKRRKCGERLHSAACRQPFRVSATASAIAEFRPAQKCKLGNAHRCNRLNPQRNLAKIGTAQKRSPVLCGFTHKTSLPRAEGLIRRLLFGVMRGGEQSPQPPRQQSPLPRLRPQQSIPKWEALARRREYPAWVFRFAKCGDSRFPKGCRPIR